MGGPTFFWVENLHTRYFFGSRDLSRIFLRLKKYGYCFGSYVQANFSFWVFVAISGSEKYSFKLFFSNMCSRKTVNIQKTIQCTLRNLSLVFFWVGNFDARYFFGSKISVLCIFLGSQYEAQSPPPPPPSCVLRVSPWGPTSVLLVYKKIIENYTIYIVCVTIDCQGLLGPRYTSTLYNMLIKIL